MLVFACSYFYCCTIHFYCDTTALHLKSKAVKRAHQQLSAFRRVSIYLFLFKLLSLISANLAFWVRCFGFSFSCSQPVVWVVLVPPLFDSMISLQPHSVRLAIVKCRRTQKSNCAQKKLGAEMLIYAEIFATYVYIQ